MKRLLISAACAVLAFSASLVLAQEMQTQEAICDAAVPAPEPETRTFSAPEQVLETSVDYRAIFCTEAGPIYIDLLEEYTPLTVNSFVFLAQQGYYNNTMFHRVLDQFMAQGGDPTGTGTGGPGYQFGDEFVGFLHFDRPGWLAMANAGPGTNGSQFFITTVPTPHLDSRHTIFGEVLDGEENVAAIRLRDPQVDAEPGTALQAVVIVTDPSSVASAYEPPLPATEEQMQADLDSIAAEVPPPLGVDAEATGIFAAEDVVGRVLEAAQEDYTTFLADNHFEYRVANRIINVDCDLESAPYTSISYTIDVFESRADATAALADGFLLDLPVRGDMVEVEDAALSYPIFTETVTECDAEMTHALTYWQRGRYVITAQATFPVDSPATADLWLTQLVGAAIYERLFADVLRAEIR